MVTDAASPEMKGKSAGAILEEAQLTLDERGKQYTNDEERNMRSIVEIFNLATGNKLSVRDGWMFMVTLKLVRAAQDKAFKVDHYIDGANYFALAGEEAGR